LNSGRVATERDFLRPTRSLRLANGLELCELRNRQAPVITSVLCYRVGARDEPDGRYGIAHFLEHMMFKGSARFGAGETDRHTQRLGGSNNAFTTHDATAYFFSFASDRWELALEIEADRMAGLELDPLEVDSERDVILEELAMVRDDPWDALAQEVRECLYGAHPYGRSVLGDRDSLRATGAEELAEFHRRRYRPGNALLVVAGDTPDDLPQRVEAILGSASGEAGEPSAPTAVETATGLRRIERRRGDLSRMLLALPIPSAREDSFAALRMLAVLLGGGRASRMHRDLVDERALCTWVGVDVGETLEPGILTVAAEVIPGVDPEAVEERVLELLAEVRRAPPAERELERARRVLSADWIFGHERIHQQALTLAWSAALFDPEFPGRQLDRALATDGDCLRRTAERWLDAERGGVIGWSHPRKRAS
jgi:zinc protease